MKRLLQLVSTHAQGIAIAAFVLAAYIVAARNETPTETDALQVSAEISNDIAAEYAAQHALVASKD